jgi:hypothetical protein
MLVFSSSSFEVFGLKLRFAMVETGDWESRILMNWSRESLIYVD